MGSCSFGKWGIDVPGDWRDDRDVFGPRSSTPGPSTPCGSPSNPSCRVCGAVSTARERRFCRRCGILFDAPPPPDVELPECPICYRRSDDEGLFLSLARSWDRVPFADHRHEHDRYPVGDDEWLEQFRVLDRIRIGRWTAPFALVRRYLVTGQLDGGRRRKLERNAIVTAMLQLSRGPQTWEIGDQAEWRDARSAVSLLLERYARGAAAAGRHW